MSKYEYRGLISAMTGAYELGSSGVELSSASLVTRGAPRSLFMRFSVDGDLINATSKVQLLKILNEAGIEGKQVDFDELSSKAIRLGSYLANAAYFSFTGKEASAVGLPPAHVEVLLEPDQEATEENLVGLKSDMEWKLLDLSGVNPESIIEMRSAVKQAEVANESKTEDTEEEVTEVEAEESPEPESVPIPEDKPEVVELDLEFIKSITPKNNNDQKAKAKLVKYAKTLGVSLDKRTGFNTLVAKLTKEVQN